MTGLVLRMRLFYSLNVLAQGREAGLPAKRPSGAAGWASFPDILTGTFKYTHCIKLHPHHTTEG